MAKKLPTRKVAGASRSKKKAPARKAPVRSTSSNDNISLPQKEQTPPKNMEDFTIFLYGKKGVGKTSLCAQFPNTTIFQWEPRRRNVTCKQIPKPGEAPLDWGRFKGYQKILTDKPSRIAIDTIDRAWAACVKWMLRKWGVQKANDLPGAQRMSFWFEAKLELAEVLEDLLFSGCNLIFTSHYKKVIIDPRDGDSFHEWEPSCGAAWDEMKVICDLVLFYSYRRAERAMTVRGTELLYASPGPEDHFKDPDGNLLIEVPLSNISPKEAYKDLQKSFHNKLYGFTAPEEEEEEEDLGNDD